MKRGFIARLNPPEVFETRLSRVRVALKERKLPALLVYSDVWRSNQARFLTNFMPYWNRSLVVIPCDGAPVLLCGLSPRVYPWIKSVTIFEDIRPAPKLTGALEQLCVEKNWASLGVLDLPMLPLEIAAGLRSRPAVDIPSASVVEPDEAEFEIRRKAVELARRILDANLKRGAGELEREYRRAGAEDVAIRMKHRDTDTWSLEVALEYCGHWVKVTRACAPADEVATLQRRFDAALQNGSGYRENLAGPHPYEKGAGAIFALRVEHQGLYYGDTCCGNELL